MSFSSEMFDKNLLSSLFPIRVISKAIWQGFLFFATLVKFVNALGVFRGFSSKHTLNVSLNRVLFSKSGEGVVICDENVV